MPGKPHRLEQNVRIYPWYVALLNAHFWVPVFFLYFTSRFGLDEALRLEAIYYFAVVLMEVPSGYASDRFGRRPTLLAGSAMLLGAHALFFLGESFAVFGVAQALLAGGFAFHSGTDVSLHFESLHAAGRADEFGAREASVGRIGMLAAGGAALAGGLAGTAGLRWAYALATLVAAGQLGLAIMFVEPSARDAQSQGGLAGQVLRCAQHLRTPILRWLFAFIVLMTVMNHVPYQFGQLYVDQLGDAAGISRAATPPILGLYTALVMVPAAWAAGRSVRWAEKMGLMRLLLAAAILQIVIVAVMALALHPLVLMLLVLRAVPRGMFAAPVSATIAPLVGRRDRATYLSLQSLVGRLAFSGSLVLLSLVPSDGRSWADTRMLLFVSAGAGAVLLAGVCAMSPPAARAQ